MRMSGGYNPTDYFNNDQDIRRVLMQLINGQYSHGDTEMFREIYDSLLNTEQQRPRRYVLHPGRLQVLRRSYRSA